MYLNPIDPQYTISLKEEPRFQLEETLLQQGSGQDNEDALSIGPDIFTVCDGSTTICKKKHRSRMSGGKRAAELTAQVFASNSGSLVDLAAIANDKILQAMTEASVDLSQRETYWATSFVSVRLKGGHLEWAQSGDCALIVLLDNGRSQLLTELPDHDYETLIKWQKQGPAETGSIHEVLAKEIAAVRRQMNHSYGVLNGEGAALDFVRSGVRKLDDVKAILLLSDGMFLPSEAPGAALEVDELVSIYQRSGLAGLKEKIRAMQLSDPRCFRYPRFKLHDDMCGIALKRRP